MRARGSSQQAFCCFTDSESWHPDALDDVVARHRGTAGKHVTRPLNHPGEHGTHTKTRLPPHSSYTINISNVHLSHRCATRRLQTPFHWPLAAMPRAPAEDLAHPAPFRSDALLLSTRYARRLRSSPAAQRRASDRRHTRGQGSREECRGDLMTGATNNQTCCSAMPLGATVDLRSPRLESPVLRWHSRPRRGLLPPHRWRSPLPRTAV